jgi:hypothetical protein
MHTFTLIRQVFQRKTPIRLACSLWWRWWLPRRVVVSIYNKVASKLLVAKDRSYLANKPKEDVDEFHPSLDMNLQAMLMMDEKEREEYMSDLVWRRECAHQGWKYVPRSKRACGELVALNYKSQSIEKGVP